MSTTTAEDTAARVRRLLDGEAAPRRAVAAAVGLDETKLSKSLAGRRRFSAAELVALAERYGVSVNWLLHGRDDARTVSAVPSPSTHDGPRRPEPGGGTDQRVREVAWWLVAERGHHRVTHDDVAAATGADPADVARVLPDGDLLAEALRRSVRLAFDRQVAELHDVADPAERLRRLVELQLPVDDLRRAEWSVWMQVWTASALSVALREQAARSYDRWLATVAMTLRDAGVPDADEAAAVLTALVDGLGVQVMARRTGLDTARRRLREHIDHVTS